MPELPWFKCYPQDALSDQGVKRCSEATRGIWFFAWFTMQLNGDYCLTGTAEQLAIDCCTSVDHLLAAFDELKRTGTAEIVEQNGQHKIICRRLLREHRIRDLKRKAGLASALKRQQTSQHAVPTEGQQPEPTRSASASASVLCTESLGGAGGAEKEASTCPPPGFPRTEDEAAACADMAGIPKAYAVTLYHEVVGRGYKDMNGHAVIMWRSFAKGCWDRRVSNDAEKKAAGKPVNGQPTAYTLRTQLDALDEHMNKIKRDHMTTDNCWLRDTDEKVKSQYRDLATKRKAVKAQMETLT